MYYRNVRYDFGAKVIHYFKYTQFFTAIIFKKYFSRPFLINTATFSNSKFSSPPPHVSLKKNAECKSQFEYNFVE